MTSSGIGRGRGWLNLKKNPTVNVPLCPQSMPLNSSSINPLSPKLSSTDEVQFVDSSNEFTDLINKVKQLNVNDDGIKFNQKIKYIVENWKQNCETSEAVEHSFDALYQACLNDTNLASKVVLMVASRSFISQEVRDQNIRLMFIKKLQNNFEGAQQLQKGSPTAFRNSVHMLGEFFNKARLANGQQLTFMASPFISYLEMLLETAQPLDLKLFTTQIYLNGTFVNTECPEKVVEMLNSIRLLLSSDKPFSKESKLWLLLALDIANNKFGLLPTEVYRFYQDQLGEVAMKSFQGAHNTLSIQTPHDRKTDDYQSKVNVLQVSTSSYSSGDEVSSAPYILQPDFSNTSQSVTSGFLSDSSTSNSAVSRSEDSNSGAGKHGRPILGVGARFNKGKSADEPPSTWTNKDQLGGWNNKQKNTVKNWRDPKKSTKLGKGWEHDDRFETDYS
ncbi:hypothetical protein NQ318_009980 [Aromia moschata]|uniref:Uncharacterized protein n=1 Tax=Aromia moschata TaxID=1265417 RepID=A0AAV8Y8U5_9CUCU|nr:hypothetical protein NQ318_009980 [Aromia moschata]